MNGKKRTIKAVIVALLMATVCSFTAQAETEEPSKVEIVNEYREILNNMTAEDFEALSEVVYWESARAACSHDVNVAVVETVMNRVLSQDFPNTVYKVCRQKGQFYRKAIPSKASREAIDDAIAQVYIVGRTVLPSVDFKYFATRKQSLGKDHIWIGELKANGKPKKGSGMYFCRGK